jgi:methylenetetrahydrofolate reductase (NADPH)
MPTLPEKFARPQDFLIGVELVSTRGTVRETRAAKTVAFARDLAPRRASTGSRSPTTPAAIPMLAAPALGRPLRDAGRETVIHLSCKDFNRNALESEAWHLAERGLPQSPRPERRQRGPGHRRRGEAGLRHRLRRPADAAGPVERRPRCHPAAGRAPARLAPDQVLPGAVVTNFKRHENEVIPQLLKAERKIAAGARWFINQIGYDSRKIHELIAWFRAARPRGGAAHRQRLCAQSRRREGLPRPAHPRGQPLRRARRRLRAHRPRARQGQGLLPRARRQAGRHLPRARLPRRLPRRRAHGGRGRARARLERGFAPDDWRQFAREIRYSRPGEFFVFAEDPATGLANPDAPAPGLRGLAARRARRRATSPSPTASRSSPTASCSRPAKGLWNLGPG